MNPTGYDLIKIFTAIFLVLINGFFVSVEFALVKVRESRLVEMVKNQQRFSSTALWLVQRMDASLSACQLGITIASLGLGWVGEPAIAHLLRPVLLSVGVQSEILLHGIAFTIAFTLITALHLVLGEQVPKIAALRRPEATILWSAVPLKMFYFFSYPALIMLNTTTAFFLHIAGIEKSGEHDTPHSEEEIRALLLKAHIHGELSRSEHRLINAVFEFDELVARRVMVPRSDVVYIDVSMTQDEIFKLVRQTKHSRYPVCDGSLDKILGVIHVKDLLPMGEVNHIEIKDLLRLPQFVPETMPVRRLLRHFQATHQHMVFLVDEYGTTAGVATLENVMEPIFGSIEDEFDTDVPDVLQEGPQQYSVSGMLALEELNRRFKLDLDTTEVETISGLLTTQADKILQVGDTFEISGIKAEVIEDERLAGSSHSADVIRSGGRDILRGYEKTTTNCWQTTFRTRRILCFFDEDGKVGDRVGCYRCHITYWNRVCRYSKLCKCRYPKGFRRHSKHTWKRNRRRACSHNHSGWTHGQHKGDLYQHCRAL